MRSEDRSETELPPATLAALRTHDTALDDVDLVPGLRAKLVRNSLAAASRVPAWIRPLSLMAATAFGVVIGIAWPRHPSAPGYAHDDGIVAKGALPAATDAPASADRWVALEIYEVDPSRRASPVTSHIAGDRPLLFAYRNLGDHPFAYLSVLGVDSGGRVFWFHPAYTDAREDPASIPIQRGGERAALELPDAVKHSFRTGPLVVVGVFSRRPLGVKWIERVVEEARAAGALDPGRPGRLPIPDTGQHVISVSVQKGPT